MGCPWDWDPQQSSPSLVPCTLRGSLAKHQRGDQVAPHTRRLEDEEEHAEIVVHHVLASFSCLLGACAPHDGEVGGVSRPERGGPESQQDGRGDQSVPAE